MDSPAGRAPVVPVRTGSPWRAWPAGLIICLCLAFLPSPLQGGTELPFADFNSQGPFNNFSGDNGTFASKGARIKASFDNRVFRGTNGASLCIDYTVRSGFCGVWNSLLGKASYTLRPQFHQPLRAAAEQPGKSLPR